LKSANSQLAGLFSEKRPVDLTVIVVLDEESDLTGVAGIFSFAGVFADVATAFASLFAVDLSPFTTTSASLPSSAAAGARERDSFASAGAAEEAREERDSLAGVDFTLGALTGVALFVALFANQSGIRFGLGNPNTA
jgi:hypothetical protein